MLKPLTTGKRYKQIICIDNTVLLKAGLRWFPPEPDGLDIKPVEVQSVFKTDIPSAVSKLSFRLKPEIMLHREHTVVPGRHRYIDIK